MKPDEHENLSWEEIWQRRVEEKRLSRIQDEEDIESGRVSKKEMARLNGGGIHKVAYIGPSKKFRDNTE